MTSENFDKTSDSVVFPYMKEGFDGREFLRNRDNFAEKREIKSVKIFEMNEANSACSESNSSLTQSLRELEKASIDRRQALSHSAFSSQPTNLTQDTRIANADYATNTAPKFAKNSTSKTADTRILGESQSDSMESTAESSENNPVIARLDEVESWQSTVENNPHEVRTLKGVVGGGERLRGEGSDFAIRKNPCIQAPSPLAEKATSDSKNLTESRRSERVKSAESLNNSSDSVESSNKMDCHEVVPTSRNDEKCKDSHETQGDSHNDSIGAIPRNSTASTPNIANRGGGSSIV